MQPTHSGMVFTQEVCALEISINYTQIAGAVQSQAQDWQVSILSHIQNCV